MTEQWGVGNQADSKAFDKTFVGNGKHQELVELIHGEHPHSRRDSNTYARFPGGTVVAFDGHRLLHEVTFTDFNYLKGSGLSGNEVRKGGVCRVKINDRCCGEFFYRDPLAALIEAHTYIRKLHDLPVQLWNASQCDALIGRKVYYRGCPAEVVDYYDTKANVRLVPDHPDLKHFPADLFPYDEGAEDLDHVLDTVLSPHIWWWREDR